MCDNDLHDLLSLVYEGQKDGIALVQCASLCEAADKHTIGDGIKKHRLIMAILNNGIYAMNSRFQSQHCYRKTDLSSFTIKLTKVFYCG